MLDTNVVVAALRSRRGASAAVLLAAGRAQFEYLGGLVVRVRERAEAAGVRLPLKAVDDILDYLASAGHQQEVFFLWRPLLQDPADDHVLELAVAGGCDAIVTYNLRDFRGVGRFGLRVETPLEFLRELLDEAP